MQLDGEADSAPAKDQSHGITELNRTRWLLLALLAAALLLQNFVWVAVLWGTKADWPQAITLITMGLGFGQAGLAAVLITLVRGPLLVRGGIALGMYFAAASLTALSTSEELGQWLTIIFLDIAIVAAPLALARLGGVQVAHLASERPKAGVWQFSLWSLVSLTTLSAALLGVVRWFDIPWEEVGACAVFALALGSIPWLCTTLTLLRPVWGILAGAGLCPLVGWVIGWTGFPPENQPVELIVMCLVQGLLTIVVAINFRQAGYRLRWPRRGEFA